MSEYRKFCYWVDVAELKAVKEYFRTRKIDLPDEARIPCRVLRPSLEAVFMAPAAWEGFCKRRTSWYRKSQKAGNFLLVSNSALNLPNLGGVITIEASSFQPNGLPTSEELSRLIQSEEFQKRKPAGWDTPDPLEKDFYQRRFERTHSSEPFDFGRLLLRHSANHANFIDPRYFLNLNGNKVPYSIGDSMHVCSSCLEFFDILGERWPVKYVVPCLGAVLFARLPADQYFEVRAAKSNDRD